MCLKTACIYHLGNSLDRLCQCGFANCLAGPLVHCLTVLELLLKAGFQLHQLLINVCILNPSQ